MRWYKLGKMLPVDLSVKDLKCSTDFKTDACHGTNPGHLGDEPELDSALPTPMNVLPCIPCLYVSFLRLLHYMSAA